MNVKRIFFLPLILLSIIACNKGTPESNQPHHNTTYVWGIDYWDEIWPADKVAASADSTLVDSVFLLNDGKSLGGIATTTVLVQLKPVIESVKVMNQYKIRGAGILNWISIGNEQTYQDSIKLAQMGFKFGKVVYAGGYHHE